MSDPLISGAPLRGARFGGPGWPTALCAGTLALLCGAARAQGKSDWPQWGRDATRNMVSPSQGLPPTFKPGKLAAGSEKIDMATTLNVKWVAKLGSQSYGNPTVANGRVYVGTNNDSQRDPRFKGDRSVVYCLSEQTGEMQWQLNVPKLGTGKVSDWEYLGICSSPAVDGDRVYLVTNRCEVMCLDVHGMANGNDGPFQDEGQYMAGPGKPKLPVKPTDADIIWSLNMIDECGVFPHNITCCSVLVVGDRIWTSTSNGVDYGHVETRAPNAPCLNMVDKKTGKLLAEEASGLSQRIFHSNWTSPAYLKSSDAELAIFGGPDGQVYAFKPNPVKKDDTSLLQLAWQYDCNPPSYRTRDGKPLKYATPKGPSEVLSTPVVYKNRIYAVIGQDPEHGEGIGNMCCIDAAGKKVWEYSKIKRSMSTLSVHDDMVFAADYSGFVYCLDANTGKEHWVHDTSTHIWGSTLVADGRVYVGTEDGFLTVIPATKEYAKDKVKEIDFGSPIYSSPIVANGVLFVATHTHLYAIGKTK
ncbi:MAG: PQQ-binding-like beta-propeller repeat protein [Planctomycetes bacterium]|nr:PQQ-binding-like beta-propeller repeat protein [Planctomycetota bacterium]